MSWKPWSRAVVLLLLVDLPLLAAELTGTVRSGGKPVADAVVSAGTLLSRTDAAGGFRLAVPDGKAVTLVITHDGHQTLTLQADPARPVEIDLPVAARFAKDIVVQAVRADAETPVTKTDVPREELERRSRGQEMPALLEVVPSLTQYSETGNGAGYNYFYLRGIQQSRVNMTFDGVPLAEPEDSSLYFVDFGDFASSVESVQVQRGVGTSTVGAASFAGSVNFASLDLSDTREVSARLGLGSFGTRRASVGLQSGLVGPGLAFYGRATYQTTDGFRDRSGVDQRSVFAGMTYRDDDSFLKVFGFMGKERTQLAFYAVEKDVLENDLTNNPLSPEEKDDFGQYFLQAQYTRSLDPRTSVALQAYYNAAGGFYRLWDGPEKTSLLQYGLDWHFFGGSLTFKRNGEHLGITAGAHWNDYTSAHRRDVVGGGRDYENNGFKNEANGFVKLSWDQGPWRLYGDAQLRWSRFRYQGTVPLGSASWTFFNPKLGVRYAVSPTVALYASVGRTTREPARGDMLLGEDNATSTRDLYAVDPEKVTDVELGLEWKRPGLTLNANVYAMEFRDEIALTGELSDVGLPLRRNVDRSYRRGLELDAAWHPIAPLQLRASANLSRSRIREWTQFYDVYGADGSYVTSTGAVFRDVKPLLTPPLVANLLADVAVTREVSAGVAGRYVASAFLDNTNTAGLETPDFFRLDASVALDLSRLFPVGRPRLKVQAENLLDRRIYASGYSYVFETLDGAGNGSLGGIPYYYPQASRNVTVTLDLGF